MLRSLKLNSIKIRCFSVKDGNKKIKLLFLKFNTLIRKFNFYKFISRSLKKFESTVLIYKLK